MTDRPNYQPQLKTVSALLTILTIIAVGFVLRQAQAPLMPLVVAWLLSCLFGPIVRFLTKRRVPLPLAILFVIFLAFYLCLLGGMFLNSRLNDFLLEYDNTYAAKLKSLVELFGERFPKAANAIKEFDWQNRLSSFILTLSGLLVNFASKIIIVMIFVVFMLMGQPAFESKLRSAFSETDANRISRILGSISGQVGQYLGLQTLISTATGISVWLVLELLNVDFARTWGALAFMLNFIPTLGSILASIPPILVALVQYAPDNYWKAIVTLIALLSIQMVIGNGIAPKLFGDRLNLSPVIVLLSLLFWGWLWGVVGALLSVLIAAAIKIVCDNITPLKPFGAMMGAGKKTPRKHKKTPSAAPLRQ